jgi:MFS family permease
VNLHRLLRLLVHGVAFSVSLLLVSAASQYLVVSLPDGAPLALSVSIFVVPLAVGIAAWSLEAYRRRRRPRDKDEAEFSPLVAVTSFGIVIYTVLGSIFAGVLTVLPDRYWTLPLSWPLLTFGLLFGVGLPGTLLVLLTFAAPRLRIPAGRAQLPGAQPARNLPPADSPKRQDVPADRSAPRPSWC